MVVLPLKDTNHKSKVWKAKNTHLREVRCHLPETLPLQRSFIIGSNCHPHWFLNYFDSQVVVLSHILLAEIGITH